LYDKAARQAARGRDQVFYDHKPRGDALPIVCTLSNEERAQRADEVTDLLGDALEVRDLQNGFAFRFPGSEDWAVRLLDYIVFERRCCRFFTFELVFEPDLGATWLHVCGPEGVKELLRGGSDLEAGLGS
jgi:hypothetical protein